MLIDFHLISYYIYTMQFLDAIWFLNLKPFKLFCGEDCIYINGCSFGFYRDEYSQYL